MDAVGNTHIDVADSSAGDASANGGAFLDAHPDFEPKDWRETCLPLVQQGPEVVAVKARLIARLAAGRRSS